MKPFIFFELQTRFSDFFLIRLMLGFTTILALPSALYADNATWTGAMDSNWVTGSNWSAPIPGNSDTASFNSAGNSNTILNLGAGVTVGNILFDSSNASAYTIGSGAVGSQTLILNNAGSITVNASVTNSQIFNSAITLGSTRDTATITITNNGASGLTLNGNISGATAGGTAGNKYLAIDGSGNTTINGNIGKGGATTMGIIKSGAGTLFLNGTASLVSAASGVTAVAISGGTINLGTTGSLAITGTGSPMPNGISGSGTITGGTVSLTNSINSTGSLIIESQLTNIGGIFNGSTTFLKNASNNFTQNISIGTGTLSVSSFGALGSGSSIALGVSNGQVANLTYSGAGGNLARNITLGGGTSTQGTINQSGTGLLKITGSVTGVTINTLTLTGSNSGSGELSGDIAAGATKLAKSGTGTWTLSGNNSYTGATTLNAGTLKLDYTTNDGSKLSDTAITGVLNLNGGTLELVGNASGGVETVLSTTISSGASHIKQTGGTTKLAMGAITFTSGTIDFSAANIATTTNANNTAGILNLRATVAGADYAANDGSNNIVAYTGYTGFTGALAADTIYSLSGSSSIAVNQSQATSGLKIMTTGAGQSLARGSTTLTLGSILFVGSHDYSISGTGTISVPTIMNYGAGTLSIGVLGGALTHSGTGKTSITGATGTARALTINGGTVSVNNTTGSFNGAGAVTVNNGGTFGGSGATSGAVTIYAGGTLAPGNSIESLATANITFASYSTYAYEMDNNAAANIAGDLAAVTGNLSLATDHTTILSLMELGDGAWGVNDKLTLISYTGTWNGGLFTYSGDIITDDSSIVFSGMNWIFNYNDTLEGSNFTADSNGNFITMTAYSVIPEPSSSLIVSLGLVFLLRRKRA